MAAAAQALRAEPQSANAPAQQQEDDSCVAQDLDIICKHGITKTDINKFKEAGFCSIDSVAMTVKKRLVQIKGITEAKVDKVLEAINKEKNFAFITGSDCLQIRQRIKRITTGCKSLDAMLGGGIESASLTEIYGEYRTGKTQWVHSLCVTAMLPTEFGGGHGKVAVIDTEGAFRPEKIDPIAARFNVKGEDVLENLIVCRCFNTDHQMQMVHKLAAIMMEQGPFSMVIIDSLTSLFRIDYVGRGELSSRQQMLGGMLANLHKLSVEFNVAVLYTNQVMSNPDGGMSFVSDPKKAVGGHVVSHASTTRLELKKGRGDQRICKVVDSPTQPEAEATFQISTAGITDPTD